MNLPPQREECCSQCPFARSTSKEYLDTRGQNGPRFIGQAHLNALLPCHMEGDGFAKTDGSCRQCAGAAKFRANLNQFSEGRLVERMGVAVEGIGELPADEVNVFRNEVELLAHHMNIGPRAARDILHANLLTMILREKEAAEAKGRATPTA